MTLKEANIRINITQADIKNLQEESENLMVVIKRQEDKRRFDLLDGFCSHLWQLKFKTSAGYIVVNDLDLFIPFMSLKPIYKQFCEIDSLDDKNSYSTMISLFNLCSINN